MEITVHHEKNIFNTILGKCDYEKFRSGIYIIDFVYE